MKKILLRMLSMATALLFGFSTSAFAQLGSLSADLVFTPVTPCRIMDTRNPGSKSGILVAGTTRGFLGWNNTGFATQGGLAVTCGLLNSTNNAAIVVNFTVVTPDAGGYITVFPSNTALPLAATVNFNAGDVKGNNATLKINQTGTGDGFNIYTSSNVHVVADVVGYYAKPVATALECVDVTSGPVPLPANGVNNTYSPACTVGYTITGGGCEVDANGAQVVTSRPYANQFFCAYSNSTASPKNISAFARCCRLPGR